MSSSKKQRTPLVIKAAKKNKPKHKTHGMFKPAVGLHGSFSSFHSVISGQSFIGGAPGMPGSRSNESFESAESHDLPEFEHMPEIGLVQISEKIGLDQSSGEAEAIIKTWRIRWPRPARETTRCTYLSRLSLPQFLPPQLLRGACSRSVSDKQVCTWVGWWGSWSRSG